MSDLTIPGVNSKYNTQKIIDSLMEVERVPLKRMEADVSLDKTKKTIWQDFSRKLSGLRDSARILFGFQNPFSNKIAASSDEKVLTATATREAIDETKRVIVKRVATADRFLSQSLPRDFVVEPGDYGFRVGDKEVRFQWKGGTLKEFVSTLNKRAGSLVSASLVNDTKTTQVMLIEAKATGSKNRLAFLDAAAEMAVKAGMVERRMSASRSVALDQSAAAGWTKPAQPSAWSVSDGLLTVGPAAQLRIPLSPSVPLSKTMVLELSVKAERLPDTAAAASPPPGPSAPSTGVIDFKGIKVESSPSKTPNPEWQPPPTPVRVDDPQVLFMEGDGKTIPLPPTADSDDFQKVQIPVGELASTMDALSLNNRNTHRRIVVKDIALIDTAQRGDLIPKKAIAEAEDAVISIDDIEITRGSNEVDDLIPGVTITLKSASATPVDLAVKRDAEGIKKQLYSMVGTYNRIITDVDVLTRKDEAVIASADYLSDEDKKAARANLGILMGDLSLQQLKGSLQTVMMNPYPTSLGRDMRLLAQIGIATNVGMPGSGAIDKTKLRGYLEIDEQKLTEAIEQHPDALKELFGNDTDGDLVVNTGLAYTLDTLLRPYVTTGGILPQKVNTLDTQIARKNKEIVAYNKHLDDYRATLRSKYGQMEGALESLQKNSQSIQNFNKNQ